MPRMLKTVVAASLSGLIGSAEAGVNGSLVAVNVPSNPDVLHQFALDDTSEIYPYHALAGNFVRGIDLNGLYSGYYITTSSSTGGTPVGLWELITDLETNWLGPLGFETNSFGGVAANPAGGFWFALDPDFVDPDNPGPSGTVLYRVSEVGDLGPVGEFFGATTGGGTDITGLAVHPITGTMYALSNDLDAIVIVNPLTAETTQVGTNGLGFDAWSLGGLDFSDDDQTLWMVSTPDGEVRTVNLATGIASPPIGQLGFVCSGLAWVDEPLPCPGDFDGDRVVTFADLNALLDTWGLDVEPWQDGDVNGDGYVDFQDLNELLDRWGAECD